MQHIVFEVHAYVIALSKTVLDLLYEKVQGNAWLILPSSAYTPNSGGMQYGKDKNSICPSNLPHIPCSSPLYFLSPTGKISLFYPGCNSIS